MTEEFEDFGDLEFADNPDPRCPIILVLDCSTSMKEPLEGETQTPMEALDGGLDTLVTELHRDPLAQRRAEISFVTYGINVNPATEFKTADNLVLPDLEEMGRTSTGAALVEALDALEDRKNELDANGVPRYKAQLYIITDGLSTDDTSVAAERIREYEEKGKLSAFAIAVEGADVNALSEVFVRQPLKLRKVAFAEFFEWISASAATVSASQPGDKVRPPSPEGWAEF